MGLASLTHPTAALRGAVFASLCEGSGYRSRRCISIELRSAIGHFGDTISTTTARTHISDTAEYRIDIARKVAETEKFVAEQRKLIAEERKLHAEADKFGRERLTLVVSSTAAATLGIAAVGGLIVKLLGW